MDGIELTEQLREESNFKFTPILIMSSHINGSERKRGEAAVLVVGLLNHLDPHN
jgi:CheY-like chemotaxis protein